MSIFETFDDLSGYFRPILGHFCRFLRILMTLRAIIGHFYLFFETFDDPSGYFRPIIGHFYRFLTLIKTLRAISGLYLAIFIDFLPHSGYIQSFRSIPGCIQHFFALLIT